MLTRRQIMFGSGLALCAGLSGFGFRAAAASPPRVVAIDWAAAEAMLSFGIVPVGLSDTAFYRQRMAAPVLPETVVDVGPFWEINLEALAALKPDFVIATDYNLVMTPRIADVARIELVPSITTPNVERYRLAIEILNRVADLCGVLPFVPSSVAEDAESRFAKARETVSKHDYAVGIMLPDIGGREMTMYGEGTLPDAVLRKLGRANVWKGPVNGTGMARVGLDRLMESADAAFLVVDIPSQRLQTERSLQQNTMWKLLRPVRDGRVAWLNQFHPFGGVPSAAHLADLIASALENMA
ncbi:MULTISPECIES: ABC transporter substrate-binding protein [Brucella]|uniref:ABC transporter substrate-binding protein n=1 Tax=Brucella TaxID=234 RepID=UPI0017AE27E3|nr:ABC transporter substrate-binding protein [Brucella anthropi]MBA8862214.1 iron complex transport system substrate-binding protein [Brucella anthropi]MDG9792871.1 ABC transporter substrate-binding protein [Brucella anthropi]MDH0581917.1 ABC transporter substrate-binding protein [Brucella anthropi]MDH0819536.1 ABC transporter substrate-binding protein [Brucella anthropi]MDH2085458.1 ABC transporter substrate-binding protein [Brucella anthropi]